MSTFTFFAKCFCLIKCIAKAKCVKTEACSRRRVQRNSSWKEVKRERERDTSGIIVGIATGSFLPSYLTCEDDDDEKEVEVEGRRQRKRENVGRIRKCLPSPMTGHFVTKKNLLLLIRHLFNISQYDSLSCLPPPPP